MNARWGLAIFIGLPVLFLIGLVLVIPRNGDFLPASDERLVTRIPSHDDGRRVAEVFEIDGDATVGFGYIVRVEGQEAAMAYKPIRKDGSSGIDVRWIDANTLEVAFGHARFARSGKVAGIRVVVRGDVDPPDS